MNTPPQDRRIDAAVLVGLAILVGIACLRPYQPYTFIFRDGSFYAQTNRAIAEGLTLRQEAFQPASWYDGSLAWYANVDDAWSNLAVGSDGEWYPKHSYLMPVFATPLYVLLGPAGLLLFNALAMVLGLFAGYRLAAPRAGPAASAVAVLAVACTPLVPYLSYSYSHDVFYAALIAGGLAFLDAARPATGGVLLGLALFAKVTNAVILVPVVPFLLGRDRRAWARAVIGGSIPLVVYALANWAMFGAPWITSYHRILTVKGGQPQIVSYGGAFDLPLAEGFRRYFSHSAEGELWSHAALPLVAWAGLIVLGFRAPGLAIGLGVGLAAFLVAFAKYRYGGARFFLPHVMLATIPLAALVDGAGRGWAATARHWAGVPGGVRRRAGIGIAAAATVAVGIAWALVATGPRGTPSMSRDVERLDVRLGGTPCDYFNLAHWKWECSGVDPGGAYFAGRALADQCGFAGRPMLRVPPNPSGKVREITWIPDAGLRGLRLVWGLEAGSKGGAAKLSVRAGGGEPVEVQATAPGRLEEVRIQGPVEAGTPVRVTVPAGARDVGLCLDVEAAE